MTWAFWPPGLTIILTKPLRKPDVIAQIEAAVSAGIIPPLSADPVQAAG